MTLAPTMRPLLSCIGLAALGFASASASAATKAPASARDTVPPSRANASVLAPVRAPLFRSRTDPNPVQVYVTTGDRERLLKRDTDLHFREQAGSKVYIEVDATVRYQSMVGFGAAMTDATATVLNGQKPRQRNALMRELFGPAPGLNLSFVRVPIGGSDFSPYHYTLDDMPLGQSDPTLAKFRLDANHMQLIPVLRSARALNPQLRIVASPWSAPAWMKDSSSLVGGRLLSEYYGVYADYLLRFVSAAEHAGVPIYALTIQNEPRYEPTDYPGMRFDPPERARFIGEFLGPRLEKRAAPLLLEWDHNWEHPESPLQVLADPKAAQYIDGVAWHCYYGDVNAQDEVHEAHPGVDAYLTECSGGGWSPDWDRALKQFVSQLMIGATRAWARGVILWNLALDEHHGPHAGGCKNCRGVVTIDSATGNVERNVEYYCLAHLSRFVRTGARRIESTSGVDELQSVAFRNRDDGSIVLLVLNGSSNFRAFSVRSAGRSFEYMLPAGAVATFTWRPRAPSP
jgi:glucosylceramidase